MEKPSLGAGHTRRRAFFLWAATLSLVLGITMTGTTVLTIGLWVGTASHDGG